MAVGAEVFLLSKQSSAVGHKAGRVEALCHGVSAALPRAAARDHREDPASPARPGRPALRRRSALPPGVGKSGVEGVRTCWAAFRFVSVTALEAVPRIETGGGRLTAPGGESARGRPGAGGRGGRGLCRHRLQVSAEPRHTAGGRGLSFILLTGSPSPGARGQALGARSPQPGSPGYPRSAPVSPGQPWLAPVNPGRPRQPRAAPVTPVNPGRPWSAPVSPGGGRRPPGVRSAVRSVTGVGVRGQDASRPGRAGTERGAAAGRPGGAPSAWPRRRGLLRSLGLCSGWRRRFHGGSVDLCVGASDGLRLGQPGRWGSVNVRCENGCL